MTNITIYIFLYYLLFILTIGVILVYFFTLIANLLVKVPFVPTSERIIKHIVKLAKLKKGEKVYDLGCGDGRFLIEAQKKTKTIATGYEVALLPYYLAKIRKYFSGAKIKINMQNFLKANLADANVIYCYLGPDVMTTIGEKIKKECRKGTRLYSNSFSIKNMKPKKVWKKNPDKKLPTIYLYQF